LKDNAFKDLFNLNHQIIKLLQQAEDRAEAESQKSVRNNRVLKEIDGIFREEGHSNILNEIKNLNEKLITENDDLLEQLVGLRKDNERLKNQKKQIEDLGFCKEQIDILERKNDVLSNKIKNFDSEKLKSVPNNVTSGSNNNQALYARFEETNAALERAFDRISSLESENNRLID
jgi:hypothetical protein